MGAHFQVHGPDLGLGLVDRRCQPMDYLGKEVSP